MCFFFIDAPENERDARMMFELMAKSMLRRIALWVTSEAHFDEDTLKQILSDVMGFFFNPDDRFDVLIDKEENMHVRTRIREQNRNMS